MKLTILDMTQNILSSLNSDEVNSISDTSEATQIANIIKTCYYNIITRADLPEHMQLFKLDSATSADKPVLMLKPNNIARLEWIKYDVSEKAITAEPEYSYVTIFPVQQFLERIHSFNPDETDVGSFSLNNFLYYYKNNVKPTCCTILKDNYIIFDAYNNVVDTTLQTSKTLCYGQIIPTFTLEDSFIPDLDDTQFPLLLNEAKAIAFVELKQQQNPTVERESRRQWNHLQRGKSFFNSRAFDALPNFGRV